MATFRKPQSQEVYDAYIANGGLANCALCSNKFVKQFSYWKIIHNKFPYDRIAKVHDMLVPLRHVTEQELTPEEQKELLELKGHYLNEQYNFLLEATNRTKSIREHFHIHLIVPKGDADFESDTYVQL